MAEDAEPSTQAVRLLDSYTLQRKSVLQRLYVFVSKYVLIGDGVWVHVQVVLNGALVLVAIFGQAHGLPLFAFHPIFMNFMVALMTEGVIVYRNAGVYNVLESIMMYDPIAKYRNLHMGMQVTSGAFGALGALFILANKVKMGKSVLPHTPHSIAGLVALLLICLQVYVGFRKRQSQRLNEQMGTDVAPAYKWHGKLGLATYDCCVFAMITGMLSYVSWSLPNLLVVASTMLTWFVAMTNAVLKSRPNEENQGAASGTV